MADAFICDGIRTPIGRYGGSLSSIRADDLAASVVDQIIKKNISNLSFFNDYSRTNKIDSSIFIAGTVPSGLIKRNSLSIFSPSAY